MTESPPSGIGSRPGVRPNGRCLPSQASGSVWKGPIKKNGPTVEIDTYSFMTTKPNAYTERINHDRLPVLLATVEEHEQWLGDRWHSLLKPFPASRMREVQVSTDKFDKGEQAPMTGKGLDFLNDWLPKHLVESGAGGGLTRAKRLAGEFYKDAKADGLPMLDLEGEFADVEKIINDAMVHLKKPGRPGD